ncbi:MAG: hypothetical protein IAG10_32695 [Planctomycetaceae bacterium]|nr:hypothetical protein [Planctomycetaceae bacterium]
MDLDDGIRPLRSDLHGLQRGSGAIRHSKRRNGRMVAGTVGHGLHDWLVSWSTTLAQVGGHRPRNEYGDHSRRGRWEQGKAGRADSIASLAVEHLKRLAGSFSTHVFPWNQDRRQLWPEFHRIQEAARLADGSPMPEGGKNGLP